MKVKVIYRYGGYESYLWVIKVDENIIDISEETYKKLSLDDVRKLLNEHVLPSIGSKNIATIENNVLTVPGLIECKQVVIWDEDDEVYHGDEY